MKDLLIECRTALGLAKSMAERERYDTDVYTKRIEMIDKALRKHATVGRSEQLKCPCCGSEEVATSLHSVVTLVMKVDKNKLIKEEKFEQLIELQKMKYFSMQSALKFWDNFDLELYKKILKIRNNE